MSGGLLDMHLPFSQGRNIKDRRQYPGQRCLVSKNRAGQPCPSPYFFPPFFLGAAFFSCRFCFWAASSMTLSRFTSTRLTSLRKA